MKAIFIVHGNRKRALATAEILQRRVAEGWDFEFHYTTPQRGAQQLALELGHTCELMVALGGDGTFHHMIQGIMGSAGAEPKPVAALVPCGSGNDYARNFGWTNKVESFLERLDAWRILPVDLIKSTDGKGTTSFTNNITDAGFGPAVVALVNRKPEHWSGKLKFSLSILQAFFTYKKKYLKVYNSEYTWQGHALTLAFAKGRYFGSGIGIAPEAKPDDGLIHLTVIGNVSLREYLMKLPLLRRAQKIKHPEVHYMCGTCFDVQGTGFMEQDGELGPELPLRLELIPKAIDVLM